MTEKESSPIKYLSFEDISYSYHIFQEASDKMEEPIPGWEEVHVSEIENLIQLPKAVFAEKELYPTLEEKASILFYKINKGHIFPNGNKRLSVLFLLLFLFINGKKLEATPDDLRDRALWLAQSAPDHFDEVKEDIRVWLTEHIV